MAKLKANQNQTPIELLELGEPYQKGDYWYIPSKTKEANGKIKEELIPIKFFEFEGAELDFTDEALRAIAERALDRDTGARALRAVAEEIMLDPLFNLPDHPRGKRWVVTEEVVRGQEPLVPSRGRRRLESA